MPPRAILSTSNKDGLPELAKGLTDLGWELYSTGGTHKVLKAAGFDLQTVEDLTGFPELMDGRVKTLHPKVHGGILARRDDPDHARQLEEHGISTIDMVVVNLYPFVETVSRPGIALDEALEQIDIGGPTLLRASAKNFPSVLTLVDPGDYESVVEKLNEPRIVSYMSSSLYTPPLSSPETLRRKGSRLLVSDASSITMYVGAVAKVDASRLASATRGRVPQWCQLEECQRAAWRVFGRRRTCERQPRGQEGKEGADPRHPRSPRQREPRPPRFLGRRRQRLASQNIYMRVCYLQAVLFPVVVVVVAVKPVVLPPWDTTTDTRGERTLALAGKRTAGLHGTCTIHGHLSGVYSCT